MTKKEIRQKFLNQRLSLTGEAQNKLSREICSQFFSGVDLSKIRTLHTFLPIVSKNEPDTWLIIKELQSKFPQIRISIPKVEGDQLINFYLDDESLEKSDWGIPEPKFGEPTPSEKIDLVLIPLLAFDKQGHRVGYGKGFYDRFLKECRPDCQRVGVSYFEPIDSIADTEAHDFKLTSCISPNKIYRF